MVLGVRGCAFAWVGAVFAVTLACSGNPTAEVLPTPTPTAAATPEPEPTVAPDRGTFCPQGSVDAVCAHEGAGTYRGVVDTAVERVIDERPELFDTRKSNGPGQPTVMDVRGYLDAVVQELQGMGYCAESRDLLHVSIKLGSSYSEKYAMMTDRGYVRRDVRSYVSTCRPSSFPASLDWLHKVRVGFYSIKCDPGITVPKNGDGILPIGCVGYVTATPKDKLLRDIPPEVHGTDIEWVSAEGDLEKNVYIDDVPDQPFNKVVTPRSKGYFGLCATVQGVEGCMEAWVVN